MRKMRNCKGFTLIEMLAVIAIVAVLVSVIVPVVAGKTDKAAAATNASNLRGLEGEITAMMLIDPNIFGDKSVEQGIIDFQQGMYETGTEELATARKNLAAAQAAVDNFDPTKLDSYTRLDDARKALQTAAAKEETCQTAYDNSVSCITAKCGLFSHKSNCSVTTLAELTEAKAAKVAANNVIPALEEIYLEAAEDARARLVQAVSDAQSVVDGLEAGAKTELDRLAGEEIALYEIHAENGVITLPDGSTLDAPMSKAVNTDTVTIAKDVDMVIYVNPNLYKAYAYYPGEEVEYSSADFAAIAE